MRLDGTCTADPIKNEKFIAPVLAYLQFITMSVFSTLPSETRMDKGFQRVAFLCN
jgi:hypothetical protein